MTVLIKDLLDQEKPKEKLINNGVENLTDTELLAVVLNTGGKGYSVIDTARELIKTYGNWYGLKRADINELMTIKNIGPTKACRIKSAIEIALRVNDFSIENKKIKSPNDIYQILKKDIFGKEKEYLYLICMNSRNNYICKELVSIGTVNESLIDPKEIFKLALRNSAVNIILVHNHPSNDVNPSNEDIYATKLIFETGKKIGILLLDHIIVSDKGFLSLKQMNLLNLENSFK